MKVMKAKYRIIEREINGELTFYPQRRAWFIWHYFLDSDGYGLPRAEYFTSMDKAVEYVENIRDEAYRIRATRARYRVAMEFEE